MKTKIITLMLGLLVSLPALAQDKTTVKANSTDISDNLDLRAVATIFGDSKDLEDFEQRLNDPKAQISNLDLNGDNYVDYLRVIESIEGNAHIIVIQAVLDTDLYQDIATVEVEKDRNNNVAIQVVGDVYMYGTNYIYEPVYVTRPVIYTTFWAPYYRPYCSAWYWGYYPSYYTYWAPYPVFRYRNNIALYINYGITYNYVNYRRCSTAYNAYYGRRANGYERRYPNRSFTHRNNGYANRYEMDQNRTIRTRVAGTRELASNTTRNSTNNGVRNTRNNESTRNNNATSIRNTSETRNGSTTRNEDTNVPIRSTTQSVRNNKNVSSTRNTTTTRTPRVSSTPNRSSSNSVSTRNSSTRSNSSMNTRTSSSSRSNSNATRSSSNTSRGQSSNRGGRS